MVVKVVSCFTNTIWLDYPMYYKLIIKTEICHLIVTSVWASIMSNLIHNPQSPLTILIHMVVRRYRISYHIVCTFSMIAES